MRNIIPARSVKPSELLILKSKLIPPAPKENVIFRSRLASIFETKKDKKLILITADAGYGKTTLLTQLIREQPHRNIYYDLDRRDSDLVVFFSYLTSGLEQIQSGLVEKSKRLIERWDKVGNDYELAMGTLINDLLVKGSGIKRLSIFLDDYHTLLEDSVVHQTIEYFIDHLPASMQIVIASRVMPTFFPLARWRAKQDLYELSRDELAFTDKEIKHLWRKVSRAILPDERVRFISERTEGWITGIQLILLSIASGRDTVKDTLNKYSVADKPLFEYFANEIIGREPATVQDFTKKTSILSIMTADACNVIFGLRNSKAMLENLERRNLFLSKLGEGQFKYHPLFRDFLRNQLKVKDKKKFNYSAARYYNRKGQIENAIEHYLLAGKFQQASNAIARIADILQEQARFHTLKSWIERMPESELEREPRLLVAQGKMCRSQGKIVEAEELHNCAERSLKKKGDWVTLADLLLERGRLGWMKGDYKDALNILGRAFKICPSSAAVLKGRILNLRGWILLDLGNLKLAKPYIMRARSIHDQAKCPSELMMVEANLGTLMVQQGDVRRAFDLFRRLIERTGGNYWWGVGILFSKAAKAALDLGQLKWAEQCLNQGWNAIKQFDDPVSHTELSHGFGLLYMGKSQWNKAFENIENSLKGFIKLRWLSSEVTAYIDKARIHYYQNELKQANRHIVLAKERMAKFDKGLNASIWSELSLLDASIGNFDDTVDILKTTMKMAIKFGDTRARLNTLLASTLFHLHKKEHRKAAVKFGQAVRIARIHGFDGILMREAHNNSNFNRLAQECDVDKNYLQLLDLAKGETSLRLAVKCLGGLQIEGEFNRLIPITWPTEKAKSLFAYLIAHRDAPIQRDILIERLWPGLDKRRGSENFRTTASRMRQSLLNALSNQLPHNLIFSYQQGRYKFLPGIQLAVDAEDFEQLINEADATESTESKARIIRQALQIYKGDYLPEIYESWADYPRQKLRTLRLKALSWLARHSADQGDDLGCVAACETYLAVDPLSESVARLCMASLKKLGRLAAVRACYKSLKRTLWRELHQTPSSELENFYASLIGYSRSPL